MFYIYDINFLKITSYENKVVTTLVDRTYS